MESEQPTPPWIQAFFLASPSDQDIDLLESIVPPSELPRSYIFEDKGEWQSLVIPDRPDQAFAVVLNGQEALIMMKGAPTEDAWDAFRNELVG